MNTAVSRIIALVCIHSVAELMVGASPASAAEPAAEPKAAAHDPAAIEFFEKEVRPVLISRCAECHGQGDKEVKGNLRVDSRAALLAGGDTGPAIVPGNLEESLLIDAVNYGEIYQMPPKSKLPDHEIAALTKWVEMGAPWPHEEGATTAITKAEFDWQARRDEHWAWQPVHSVAPPEVRNTQWAETDIDRFILSKLEENDLLPAPEADRRAIVRRLYYDLIGLPPSAEQVERFVADSTGDAYERLVDELLASPHFGEKWARHWLDLVRYGETRGHEFEPLVPNAYQYRDYLIRAWNADLSYDQMVREHLAGDLLPQPRLNPEDGFNESILGTGFWFLGEEVHSPVDIRKDETDRLDNRIDVMTKTFLGLTVACARCHDHKFDAIAQSDYYALSGFLLSSTYRQARFESMEHNRKIAEKLELLQSTATAELNTRIASTNRGVVEQLDGYLLAAAEVARGAANASTVAKERKLDATLVDRWAKELRRAEKQPAHPLHSFARLSVDSTINELGRFAALWQPIQETLRSAQAVERDYPVEQVIIDYAQATPEQWFADGFTFGLRPVRPGDFLLSADPQTPLANFVTRGAARRDPAWNSLKVGGGTEKDHGGLGGWDRAGRTIRTPKVTLKSGKLWYLVRGALRSYAVVDSHLVVAGPLHGRVLGTWKTKNDNWRWVRHDLSVYSGHRVHIEFTPLTADGVVEIAKVIESPQTPPNPSAAAPELLAELQLSAVASLENLAEMAAVLQQRVLEISAAQADGRLAQLESPRSAAEFAAWMKDQAALFSPSGADLEKELTQIATPFVAKRVELIGQIRNESRTALAMFEGNGVDEHVLLRGVYQTTGELTPRRSLLALGGAPAEGYGPGSGRLQLAEQILDAENPFASRVMVNRVWHHLLGRGIVPTVNNFGVLGQSPSHPELLDFLADRFRNQQRWSVKALIKSIVMSRTYRSSSTASTRAAEIDPDNLLLSHASIRRLSAEAIRDTLLAVSGRLDPTLYGQSVEVHLTPFMQGRGRPGSGPLDGNGRRTIYIKVRRNFLSPMLLAYDMPIPFNSFGRRSVSNVPAQALILLNDPLVIEQTKRWAAKAIAQHPTTEARLTNMYLTAFARPPRTDEATAAQEFIQQQAELYGLSGEAADNDPRVWADLAHVLINSKELIFLR